MNIINLIKFISMLITLIRLVLNLTESIKKGISDFKEIEAIKKKKKEIDKFIDDGNLDELNKLYNNEK
jgi:hypothetical protein